MSNQILLVEDDIDLLESYEESLELSGYSVLTSSSGKQGLEMYEKNQPCMVFSDVKMNGMDGYELYSKIRDLDPTAKMILITGHENKEKTVIAKTNGLLDVLYKPVSNDAFDKAIKKNGC